MWHNEYRLGPGQSTAMSTAASPRLPQIHIALLGAEAALRIPEGCVSIVLVLRGSCAVESTRACFEVASRHFLIGEHAADTSVRSSSTSLALVLCLSPAALRCLRPKVGCQPLPGGGRLDDETLLRLIGTLRNAGAVTTQFWRREPMVRALLHRISLLQIDLLARISACPGKSLSRKMQVMSRMQRARLYLEANADRNVRIAELAEISNYSHCYFTKTFHRVYGVSPKSLATRLRLERARRMLRDRERSVGEVAAACGFDNASVFARVFRQHFGVNASSTREAAIPKPS